MLNFFNKWRSLKILPSRLRLSKLDAIGIIGFILGSQICPIFRCFRFFNLYKQLKSKLKLKDAKSKSVKYNEKNIKEYFCNLIDDININEKIKELENKISTLLVEENKYEEIVEENKYEEALKVSNLKYLFNSKTNEAFELNYKLACISKIQDNKDLRKTLRDKYFSKLFSSIVAND